MRRNEFKKIIFYVNVCDSRKIHYNNKIITVTYSIYTDILIRKKKC